jgi:curved DNA-binding protein
LARLKDYYAILGVPRNATLEQIKEAYRRLAKEYHPDKNPSPEAEERFKLINEAYQVLSDPASKSGYDASYCTIKSRIIQPKYYICSKG